MPEERPATPPPIITIFLLNQFYSLQNKLILSKNYLRIGLEDNNHEEQILLKW